MAQQKPLLMNELTLAEQAALAAVLQMPGWLIVEKLHMDACRRATADVIAQEPTEEGYERKVVALTSRAKERNEFSLLILKSAEWHANAVSTQKTEEKEEKPLVNPIIKPLYGAKA